MKYLNDSLKSIDDFNCDFYSNENGERLEVLLQFLSCHKGEIVSIFENNSKTEILVNIYTSDVISGDYNCFRFDLSKFPQTYNAVGNVLTLYRIGREGECKENLGNSWSKSINGLKNYAQSSSLTGSRLENRPIS